MSIDHDRIILLDDNGEEVKIEEVRPQRVIIRAAMNLASGSISGEISNHSYYNMSDVEPEHFINEPERLQMENFRYA